MKISQNEITKVLINFLDLWLEIVLEKSDNIMKIKKIEIGRCNNEIPVFLIFLFENIKIKNY